MNWFFVWLFSFFFFLSFFFIGTHNVTSAKKGWKSTFDYACLLSRDKCQVDAECEFNMICCPTPCGNNCLFPMGELIVFVDVVFLSSISLGGRNWSENFKIVFFTGEFKLVFPKGGGAFWFVQQLFVFSLFSVVIYGLIVFYIMSLFICAHSSK